MFQTCIFRFKFCWFPNFGVWLCLLSLKRLDSNYSIHFPCRSCSFAANYYWVAAELEGDSSVCEPRANYYSRGPGNKGRSTEQVQGKQKPERLPARVEAEGRNIEVGCTIDRTNDNNRLIWSQQVKSGLPTATE